MVHLAPFLKGGFFGWLQQLPQESPGSVPLHKKPAALVFLLDHRAAGEGGYDSPMICFCSLPPNRTARATHPTVFTGSSHTLLCAEWHIQNGPTVTNRQRVGCGLTGGVYIQKM